MNTEEIISKNIETFAKIFDKCINKAGMLLEEVRVLDSATFLSTSGLFYVYVDNFCKKNKDFDINKFLIEEFSAFIIELVCEER